VAQTDTTKTGDSIGVYRLGQVVVGGNRSLTTAQVRSVPISRIVASDAPSVSGLATLVPSARTQTNSRGESLVYIRGAGERQVALFFDGALINVPWDNRLDLSLVPTGAVGGVAVTRGVPSVLWGMNVLGGAINISSQEMSHPGALTEITLTGGQHGYYNATGAHLGSTGAFNYIGTVGISGRDGIPLPDRDALGIAPGMSNVFNQRDSVLRTNTASQTRSGFVRGEYRFSDAGALGLSVSAIDAHKGVAPESHIEDARFWRYANWLNITTILSGEAPLGNASDWGIRGSLWWNGFEQTIDQYTDDTYALPTDRQEDNDATLGGRAIVEFDNKSTRVSIALNVLQSQHDQRDLSLDSMGGIINGETTPTLSFKQSTISAGIEAETRLWQDITATAGVGYDLLATPVTGDKPQRESQGDVQATAGLSWRPTPSATVSLTAGRKTRFPTLRELFGEALHRFLVNPDLKPERSTMVDVACDLVGESWRASVGGFARVTSDAIDQRNVSTPTGVKRQRINLPGTRTFGIEATGGAQPVQGLQLDGQMTWLHARGIATTSDGVDSTFELVERPSYLAAIRASWRLQFGIHPSAEIELTGPARGLDDDNSLVDLEASAIVNLRLAYHLVLPFNSNGTCEVFVRANNVFDDLTMPQLGLPGAGREVLAGMKIVL